VARLIEEKIPTKKTKPTIIRGIFDSRCKKEAIQEEKIKKMKKPIEPKISAFLFIHL